MTEPVSSMSVSRAANRDNPAKQAGVAMMEALISMAVLLVGLLGIVGLQAKTQTSHFEAYQRAQALLLLDDMVNRISANRYAADCYVVTNGAGGTPYLGTDGAGHRGNTACTAITGTAHTRAVAEAGMGDWDALLQGAAEVDDANNNRGAMIGARGCVSYNPLTEVYTVTVAWQGMVATMAPAVDCANGEYGPDTMRRAVSSSFRIARLVN